MPRLAAVTAVALFAAAAPAADPPERLLSPTGTRAYVRWDGVTPHALAYLASPLGGFVRGPAGGELVALLDRLPAQLGSAMLSDPVRDGRPLAELKAVHADLKQAAGLPALVLDRGLIVAVETADPKPTVAGLARAVGGLLGVGDGPPANLVPDVRAFLVVPDVGERAAALFAANRVVSHKLDANTAVPLPAELKVTGFTWPLRQTAPLHVGWWVIDGHFVEYVGTAAVEDVVAGMRANGKAGGITNHPLLGRATKAGGGFESVARGFADAGYAVDTLKRLAGPFAPGLAARLDAVGLGSLKAVTFASGFAGGESRAVWEFDLPGERAGFAGLLKRTPLTPAELPPLPPDCSRFSALRVDWAAAYDGGLSLVEWLAAGESFGEDVAGESEGDRLKRRRAFLAREVDKHLGVSVRDDLLPNLGDVVVLFQSPAEGLQVFGQAVAVKCKDAAAVRGAMDRVQRAVDAAAGTRVRVKRKQYAGAEIRELYARDFGVVTPAYAVVGDWLVVAGNPQIVQGFALRVAGRVPGWKPDAATAVRLAKFPPDAVGLQYCDPKSTAQNVCCVGPLFLAAVTRFRGSDGDTTGPDVGLVPNAHELSRHLFPNLVATRDDGTTVRVEVNESFSLPLDVIGFDPFIYTLALGLARF